MKYKAARDVIFQACAAAVFGLAAACAAFGQTRVVTIISEPGAAVWIDGVRFGETGTDGRLAIRSLSEGRHSVRVRADGFGESSKTLLPAAGGDLRVALAKTTDKAELAFQNAERLSLRDREKAVAAYRTAIELRPAFPAAYIGLARVLAEMENYDGAAKAIAALKRKSPANAEASAVEGRIYRDTGEETKAIAAFKRSISEGKGFQPEAYTGLGLLYKDKAEGFGASGDFANEMLNYDEAAKYLRSALKQLSGAPDANVLFQLLGLVYERQKKYPEAIAVYEEFLTSFPDSNDAPAVRSFIVQFNKQMEQQ
jgi:tetratricopeptide (TPR) repeat protein